jgi:hypothetical protein
LRKEVEKSLRLELKRCYVIFDKKAQHMKRNISTTFVVFLGYFLLKTLHLNTSIAFFELYGKALQRVLP